jgi:hypothetical protein
MYRSTSLTMVMALLGVVTVAEADPVRVDQMVTPNSGDHATVSGDIVQAQTFTVGTTGTLASLDLYISWTQTITDVPGSLLVDIRPTTNGVPVLDSAAAFTSFSFRPSGAPTSPPGRLFTVDLSGAGLNVYAGELLAFALRSPESLFLRAEYQFGAASTNPYSRGALFTAAPSLGLPEMTKDPRFDLAFTTYVSPAPVPEPATLTLVGIGLAGYGWRARRQLVKRNSQQKDS